MKCQRCGFVQQSSARFCPQCGSAQAARPQERAPGHVPPRQPSMQGARRQAPRVQRPSPSRTPMMVLALVLAAILVFAVVILLRRPTKKKRLEERPATQLAKDLSKAALSRPMKSQSVSVDKELAGEKQLGAAWFPIPKTWQAVEEAEAMDMLSYVDRKIDPQKHLTVMRVPGLDVESFGPDGAKLITGMIGMTIKESLGEPQIERVKILDEDYELLSFQVTEELRKALPEEGRQHASVWVSTINFLVKQEIYTLWYGSDQKDYQEHIRFILAYLAQLRPAD